MKKLEFPNNDQGKERYEICSQAIMLAGKAVDPKDWDDFLPLIKHFKAIGIPAKNQPQGTKENRPVLFDLNGANILFLERGEYNLLLDLVTQPIWRPQILEAVIEVRDWLKGIEDHKDENGVIALAQ